MEISRLKKIARRRRGASLTESGLLVALVSLVALAGVSATGGHASCTFEKAANRLGYDGTDACERLADLNDLEPDTGDVGSGDPTDNIPDPFDFTDIFDESLEQGEFVLSELEPIKNFKDPLSVDVTTDDQFTLAGDGFSMDSVGEVSIGGRPWSTSGIVNSGDRIRLRVRAPAKDKAVKITVAVGPVSSAWIVATRAEQPVAPEWQVSGALGLVEAGKPLSRPLTAASSQGRAVTYSLAAGSQLPAGLELDSATGVISGTPSASGDRTFTLRVSDDRGLYTDQAFTISVRAAPAWVTAGALPVALQGLAYSAALHATDIDSASLTYALAPGSSALPGGLSLSSAGVVSSSNPSAGDVSFTARVTDETGLYADRTFTLSFQHAPEWVTPATLVGGIAGAAYTAALVATDADNPALTFSLAPGSAALPGTMTLSGGILSGSYNQSGNLVLTIRATDSTGFFVDRAFTASFTPPPPSSTLCPAGTFNQAVYNGRGGCVFTYTGSTQTWTVPNYVGVLNTKIWGGGGGGWGYAGGGGGATVGSFTATPGSTITVYVGRRGLGSSTSAGGAGQGAGGSAVLRAGTLIGVAGGGGGGSNSTIGHRGGAGGGANGQAGELSSSGGGGSQSAGGSGGSYSGDGHYGTAGGSGPTGVGGCTQWGATNHCGGASWGYGRGSGFGGGGGYFSGGGGGAISSVGYGAGGGGSGYASSGLTGYTGSYEIPALNSDADRSGAGTGGAPTAAGVDGLVIISW